MAAAFHLLPGAALLVWLAMPPALVLVWQVVRGRLGPALNRTLAHTGQVHLLLGVLLTAALAL
jgi:hypothetical protein